MGQRAQVNPASDIRVLHLQAAPGGGGGLGSGDGDDGQSCGGQRHHQRVGSGGGAPATAAALSAYRGASCGVCNRCGTRWQLTQDDSQPARCLEDTPS